MAHSSKRRRIQYEGGHDFGNDDKAEVGAKEHGAEGWGTSPYNASNPAESSSAGWSAGKGQAAVQSTTFQAVVTKRGKPVTQSNEFGLQNFESHAATSSSRGGLLPRLSEPQQSGWWCWTSESEGTVDQGSYADDGATSIGHSGRRFRKHKPNLAPSLAAQFHRNNTESGCFNSRTISKDDGACRTSFVVGDGGGTCRSSMMRCEFPGCGKTFAMAQVATHIVNDHPEFSAALLGTALQPAPMGSGENGTLLPAEHPPKAARQNETRSDSDDQPPAAGQAKARVASSFRPELGGLDYDIVVNAQYPEFERYCTEANLSEAHTNELKLTRRRNRNRESTARSRAKAREELALAQLADCDVDGAGRPN
jgi:hypothetical protein